MEGPIEFVVPFAAGGGTDQTARRLADIAEETCQLDTVVTNQEGATGAIGFQAIANAPPTGATVGVVTAELAMLDHLGMTDVSPDDMTALLQYNFDPAAFTVDSDSSFESIADVVETAESGEMVSVGTSGAGSIWEISAAGMAQKADIELTRAPFNGAAEAITALRGGVVSATSASGAEVREQVKAGELRPLAVMSEERLDILPNTPTLTEEGIDWVSGTWRGLAVPKDTPKETVDRLERCFTEAVESPEFVEFMDTAGFGREYRGAEEFATYMDEQYRSFGQIIPQVTGE
ncbi:tripartite-type tricarboxylate transporter receptor subunit TctC [Spinactinospora alkalitolerans]|uniref:Tripartite-type tricarboxylate transporter receptor subunit TctC n=1 Tax=Spinactinospora alkalitolerans TaxID=687207 RepID=A0A852U363_9ACTN|nr:tripartite tricarboxylate transporter substrate binding protein [Spinactinospora alkalitolerans]NYE48390.1 tripartite-type tricarboxylate transporter receptor subunit TctC [Spinactinospora alkalitolerans]